MSTRIVAVSSWALVLAGVWSVVAMSAAVAAPSDECPTINDFCLEEELDDADEPGDNPAAPVGDHDDQGPTDAGGPVCTWEQRGVAGPSATGDGSAFTQVDGTPEPGAEFLAEVCDGVFTGRARWIAPGDPVAPTPPAPVILAEAVRVRLEGSLPAPEVVTTPGTGVAALVGYPSFVSIANWTGVVTEGECDPTGLLCVTVTATPSMRWAPGEPDVAPLECSGPGLVFDPAGPHPDVQAAAPGACAHAFEMRSAVPGRPRHWPGVVSVEWSLAWTSSTGGGGSLTPVTKSADVPREVNEVQSVVVSAGE